MPVPALRDVITPTSTANGLPAATLNERFLLTLAMLATGTAPDGTTLPGGGARIVLGPLTLTATGTVSGLPTLFGTASLPLGPLTTTTTGSVPAAGPPVAGYLAWYDASQITGQTDGSALASWPDLTGNHNMSQATPANQPTYYSSTVGQLVNGKPVVRFNGSPDAMISSGAVLPQTIFFTVKLAALSATQGVVGTSSGNGTLFGFSTTNDLLLVDAAIAALGQSTGAVTLAAATVGMTYDGTTINFYINSGTIASSVSITHTMPSAAMSLGFDGASIANYLNGAICEVLAYPTVLSAANITATVNYLKTKWGT